MVQPVAEYYFQKASAAAAEVKQLEKRINTYSFLRLFTLIAGGILLYQTTQFELIWLTELLVFLVIIAFAWLVKQQSKFEKSKAFFIALQQVCENETASIANHSNIYSNGEEFADDQHVYTSDLDFFGESSLYELINRCASPLGRTRLASWLDKPAATLEILKRQAAVKELSSKADWVQDFKASLLFARQTDKRDINDLFTYLHQESEVVKPLVKAYVKVVPLLFAALLALVFIAPKVSVLLLLTAIINGALVLSHSLRVNRTDRLITKAGKTLGNYSDAFQLLERETWQSELNQHLQQNLKGEAGLILSKQLKVLSVLAGRLEVRLNMFIGPLLNGILAWDVRQLIAIEKWKAENKFQIENAFDVIAEFESLVSLSSLHSNYPEWCFPEIAEGEGYTYTASAIGHPLIYPAQRVENDFGLSNEFKIDIITGSNMAGKSTFLRTLGINGVLALCGAPVCAARMLVSNMRFFTYMRIRDSLNESISTFRAELNRLQLLLNELGKKEKVYFLIDEMLRGTNSVDKYLGSKAIIEKLIDQKAVGIVATHDLLIAELEKSYPDYIRNFYFDIKVEDGEMKFNYKLKHGECKTFNASLLLKQLGIDVQPH